MNSETDDLERSHVRLYASDMALLRAAFPRGAVTNKVRDIVHDYCALHSAELFALASSQR